MNSSLDAPGARAIRSLRQWIDEGVLAPGHPIPTERALAETLKVNRGTVRRALAVLDEQGLLHSNGGKTRFVAAGAARGGSLMSETVAILTPFARPLGDGAGGGSLQYITQGVFGAVQSADLHTLSLHPGRITDSLISRLAAERPFGLVVTDLKNQTSNAAPLAQKMHESGVPVVVYGGASELATYDRVTSDHEAGSYELTRWLITQGRRRIVNLWPAPATGYWFGARRAGYERAMREAGLEPLPTILMPDSPQEAQDRATFEGRARQIGAHLIEHLTGENPIDALMLGTDSDVFRAAAALRLFGKVPNQDVALVGYDNYWPDSPEREWESAIPLASIDKNNVQLGTALVQLLRDRVGGQLPDEPQCRIVAPRLAISEIA